MKAIRSNVHVCVCVCVFIAMVLSVVHKLFSKKSIGWYMCIYGRFSFGNKKKKQYLKLTSQFLIQKILIIYFCSLWIQSLKIFCHNFLLFFFLSFTKFSRCMKCLIIDCKLKNIKHITRVLTKYFQSYQSE